MNFHEKGNRTPQERLRDTIQTLEDLEQAKKEAGENFSNAFKLAEQTGFDTRTLKRVLALRKMTAAERAKQRDLEAIYMLALGMMQEGDELPDSARRKMSGREDPEETPAKKGEEPSAEKPAEKARKPDEPQEPPLPLKTPEEAHEEGRIAGEAGKMILDNPYPAGDPLRKHWDHGWCTGSKSTGMDIPKMFGRRKKKDEDNPDKGGEGDGAPDGDAPGKDDGDGAPEGSKREKEDA